MSQSPITSVPDCLLTPQQAAQKIGMTVRFLEQRRHRGGGPRFISVSTRAVRYRLQDLDAWIEGRARTSTADNGDE